MHPFSLTIVSSFIQHWISWCWCKGCFHGRSCVCVSLGLNATGVTPRSARQSKPACNARRRVFSVTLRQTQTPVTSLNMTVYILSLTEHLTQWRDVFSSVWSDEATAARVRASQKGRAQISTWHRRFRKLKCWPVNTDSSVTQTPTTRCKGTRKRKDYSPSV